MTDQLEYTYSKLEYVYSSVSKIEMYLTFWRAKHHIRDQISRERKIVKIGSLIWCFVFKIEM